MNIEVITFESVNLEICDETKLECINVSPHVNDSISMTTADGSAGDGTLQKTYCGTPAIAASQRGEGGERSGHAKRL